MGSIRRPAGLLMAVLVALAPGCGTLLGLSRAQELEVETQPAGATLWVDGLPHAEATPTLVELSPRSNHVLQARVQRLDGALVKGQTAVNREVRIPIVVLDGLLTAGVGLLVDYLTGALYTFTTDRVLIHLGSSPIPPPSPEVRLSTPDETYRMHPAYGGRDTEYRTYEAPPEDVGEEYSPSVNGLCAICDERRGDGPSCQYCGMQ